MNETSESKTSLAGCDLNYPVRLGIIGGGQLARMTAVAALPLGVDVVVLATDPESPAARIAAECRVGDWADADALAKFAADCDVITLENEFVDSNVLAGLEQAGHRVFPSAACIAVTQDKLLQKDALKAADVAVPKYRAVASPEEIVSAGKEFGWPVVLKTRRNGYDGKGNFTVRSETEVAAGWEALGGARGGLMVEAFFPFVKELAVIIVRSLDGHTSAYPVVETIQRNHVCHVVKAPAEIAPELAERAAGFARRAVECVDGVGSFGVEMFLADSGDLVINELAPRVHNSGHYTIEACVCSQFENHARAVLGWPLGDTRMVAPAAVMVNLLGKSKTSGRPNGLLRALEQSGAHLHLYGKLISGPGRKMGHVTVLESSVEKAQSKAESAAQSIYFGEKG